MSQIPTFPLEHYYSLKCLEKKHVCNTLMTLSGLLFQAVGWKEKIVLQMTSFYLSSNNFNQPFPHLGLIFAQGAQNYHLLSRWILNRLLQVHCQWNFWVKSPDNTPSTSSMLQPPPFPTGPLGEKKKEKKSRSKCRIIRTLKSNWPCGTLWSSYYNKYFLSIIV